MKLQKFACRCGYRSMSDGFRESSAWIRSTCTAHEDMLFYLMTLQEAAQTYSVAGFDSSMIGRQEDAFQACLHFLQGVEKTKGPNRRRNSYGLKHIVERPAGPWGIPSSLDCYYGYIYEGTFILAALASGFTMWQDSIYLKGVFNMSQRSLRRRTIEIAAERSRTPVLLNE
jgi:hypothetical protein